MIIRHLPFFAAAAEEENLQRAASRLGITQPALSRRIRDLEDELGVPLFERVSGRLRLTPTGSYLRGEARRIVDEVDAIARRLRARAGRDVARLAVGLNERALAIGGVGEAIRTLRQDNSACEVQVLLLPSTEQHQALSNGDIDLALMYLRAPESRFASRRMIDDDPFVAVLPPSHRLARPAALRLEDLDGEDLIWPSAARIPITFEHLSEVWRSSGVQPQVTTQVNTGEAAIHAVQAALGIAIIRRSTLHGREAGVAVRPVAELAANPLPMHLVWAERRSSPPLRRFLSLLADRKLI